MLFVFGQGYIKPSTLHDNGRILTFKFEFTNSKGITINCNIYDKSTKQYVLDNIYNKEYLEKLCGIQGILYGYKFTKNGKPFFTYTIRIDTIEFMKFDKGGRQAIDSGRFYDRKIKEWQSVFNKGEDRYL